MDKGLRLKLAEIWKECLEVKLDIFDDKSQEKLLLRHWFDEIPQPGFVGHNYKRRGILFIGINPGSATPSAGLDYDNLILYGQLAALRIADDAIIEKRFDALNGFLLGFGEGRSFFKQQIGSFLARLNRTLSEVAYINLLKWRTKNTDNLVKLYEKSWEGHYTRNQIKALAPGNIIALGKTAGDWLKGKRKFDKVLQKAIIHINSRKRNISKEKREENVERICRAIQRTSKW